MLSRWSVILCTRRVWGLASSNFNAFFFVEYFSLLISLAFIKWKVLSGVMWWTTTLRSFSTMRWQPSCTYVCIYISIYYHWSVNITSVIKSLLSFVYFQKRCSGTAVIVTKIGTGESILDKSSGFKLHILDNGKGTDTSVIWPALG